MGKFSISGLMNEHSKAEGSGNTPTFKVDHIYIKNISPSERNKYTVDDITELKASIELHGLQQNLLVRKLGTVEDYEIISGHRRYKALCELTNEGKAGFDFAPCRIIKTSDDIQAELQLILANSTTRRLTDFEITYQAGRVKELLTLLSESGYKIEGRKREIVANMLEVSASQVARMESINKNLTPGLMQAFKEGNINITTAYEASRLKVDQQAEILEKHSVGETITPSKVKEKREKPPTETPKASDGQKLKPCPFCGHSASLNKEYNEISYSRWVTCDGCLVATKGYSGAEAATLAWNKRV